MTEMIPVPYINLPLVPGMSRPKTCSNASLVFAFVDFRLLWETVQVAVTCQVVSMPRCRRDVGPEKENAF